MRSRHHHTTYAAAVPAATCNDCGGSGWIGDIVCPGCDGKGQK
ncbi:hypothetical protein [Streptomyces mashuensis]|nr:hypothetical protein [Streptomyces mashuensis]